MADTPEHGLPKSREAARWYEADLARCPQCGQHSVITRTAADDGARRTCLTCGALPDGLEPEV